MWAKAITGHYRKGVVVILVGLGPLSPSIQTLIPYNSDDDFSLFSSLAHYSERKENEKGRRFQVSPRRFTILNKNSRFVFLDLNLKFKVALIDHQ